MLKLSLNFVIKKQNKVERSFKKIYRQKAIKFKCKGNNAIAKYVYNLIKKIANKTQFKGFANATILSI
jgi:hypothetical protein